MRRELCCKFCEYQGAHVFRKLFEFCHLGLAAVSQTEDQFGSARAPCFNNKLAFQYIDDLLLGLTYINILVLG